MPLFVNISEMISSITSSMDALVMSIAVRVAVVVAVSVVTVTVAVAVMVVPLVLLVLLMLVTVVVKLVTNAVVWTTEVMDLVLVAVKLMEAVTLAVPEFSCGKPLLIRPLYLQVASCKWMIFHYRV